MFLRPLPLYANVLLRRSGHTLVPYDYHLKIQRILLLQPLDVLQKKSSEVLGRARQVPRWVRSNGFCLIFPCRLDIIHQELRIRRNSVHARRWG